MIGVATGFAVIASFLALAYDRWSSANPGPELAYEVYLVISNAFLIAILIVVSILYADSRRNGIRTGTREVARTARVLQQLENIFRTRTGLGRELLDGYQDGAKLNASVIRGADYLRFLVDETRAIFEDYTTHPCSVSIKLLVPSDEGVPSVKTYLRDKRSELNRIGPYPPGGLYPYSDHSPFVGIISGGAGNYFLSNDLRAAEKEGRYRNGNPHWRKLYNSTLIVAIQEPDVFASENMLGFLCIDSMTAKFDDQSSLYIARIVAHTIFYVISVLSQLEQKHSTNSNPARAADA